MTQSSKMQAALVERVIPKLIEQGFSGEYPHFCRVMGDRTELLGFLNHRYGGAFNVEVSVIFPKRPKEQSNYYTHDFEPPDKATVFFHPEEIPAAGDVRRLVLLHRRLQIDKAAFAFADIR